VNCLQFNLSHHVGHLSFGMDYPGQVNPLDGTEQFAEKGYDLFAIFVAYFLIIFFHLASVASGVTFTIAVLNYTQIQCGPKKPPPTSEPIISRLICK